MLVDVSVSVVQVKLVPTKAQERALAETLKACNEAANFVSEIAHDRHIWGKYDLRKVTYGDVRARFGLKSQTAQQVIGKVTDAYKSGDKRRRYGAAKRCFRKMSSQPFDRRNLSVHPTEQTISITLTDQRHNNIRYLCANWQNNLIVADIARRGHVAESDLVWRDGQWFLAITIDIETAPLNTSPSRWLGVDMGIVNIATTSDGDNHSGKPLNHLREQHRRTRKRLQQKGTRSTKRRLAQQSGREARFSRNLNHCISKTIVAEAKRTGRGIAIEQLDGIRNRARFRKPQRATLHSWSFHQLGTFIQYKAERAGVPVIEVDPRYTSQTCHKCQTIDKKARVNRDTYRCTNPACSFVGDADENAAHNIASRGAAGWAVSHAAKRPPDVAA